MTFFQHFDRPLAEERLAEDLAMIDTLVDLTVSGKQRLSSLTTVGIHVAGYATTLEDEAALRKGLDIVVDAGAATFELASLSPGTAHEFEVCGRTAPAPATGPNGLTNAGRWLGAWYAAVARGSAHDGNRLAIVDEGVFDGADRDGMYTWPYVRAWLRALRALWMGSPVGDVLLEALQGTDPEALDPRDVEIALDLYVPLMKMVARLLEGDEPGFAQAHDEAVEYHQRYHTRTPDRQRNPRGALALGVVAIREIAVTHGRLKRLAPTPYTPETTGG